VGAEKQRLREELKRLKTLKRKELEAKLAAVARVSGAAGALRLRTDDLDADWDETAHEAMMGAAFGAEYYGAQEAEAEELHKPQFGDLDEELRELLAAAPAGEPGRGFAAAAARRARAAEEAEGAESDGEEEEEEEAEEAAEEETDEDGRRWTRGRSM